MLVFPGPAQHTPATRFQPDLGVPAGGVFPSSSADGICPSSRYDAPRSCHDGLDLLGDSCVHTCATLSDAIERLVIRVRSQSPTCPIRRRTCLFLGVQIPWTSTGSPNSSRRQKPIQREGIQLAAELIGHHDPDGTHAPRTHSSPTTPQWVPPKRVH
jgi:hypothetical protein